MSQHYVSSSCWLDMVEIKYYKIKYNKQHMHYVLQNMCLMSILFFFIITNKIFTLEIKAAHMIFTFKHIMFYKRFHNSCTFCLNRILLLWYTMLILPVFIRKQDIVLWLSHSLGRQKMHQYCIPWRESKPGSYMGRHKHIKKIVVTTIWLWQLNPNLVSTAYLLDLTLKLQLVFSSHALLCINCFAMLWT